MKRDGDTECLQFYRAPPDYLAPEGCDWWLDTCEREKEREQHPTPRRDRYRPSDAEKNMHTPCEGPGL